MAGFLASLGVALVVAVGGFCAKMIWDWQSRIEFAADDWEIGVNKDPDPPGSELVIFGSSVPGWASYFASLKFVNRKAKTVNVRHLAIEFRSGKKVVFRDDSAVNPLNLDLPPNQTVAGQLDGQHENIEELRNCDSVWIVAEEIGGRRRQWPIVRGNSLLF
jgi:hypothetical protein